MNSFKMAKVFNLVPKWQNFAKSGHTARLELLAKLVWVKCKGFLFRRFSGERQDFGARKADPEKASGGSFKRGKRRRRRRRRSAARNCDRILKHFLRKNKTKKIAISLIAKVCRRERSLLKKLVLQKVTLKCSDIY